MELDGCAECMTRTAVTAKMQKDYSYKYNHSLKGKRSRKRYNQSPKGKIAQQKGNRNWRRKPGNKKRQAADLRKWRRTPKGRKALYKYNNSTKGRRNHLKYDHSIRSRYKKLFRRFKKLRKLGKVGICITVTQYQRILLYKNGAHRLCHYCSGEINKTGSGIDRKDSSINYTLLNSVACCRGCNSWKADDKTYKETRKRFKPLREHKNDEKNVVDEGK